MTIGDDSMNVTEKNSRKSSGFMIFGYFAIFTLIVAVSCQSTQEMADTDETSAMASEMMTEEMPTALPVPSTAYGPPIPQEKG